MSATLAFDVYGTLIDTQGVLSSLENMIGDKAGSFSQTWREKQLDYCCQYYNVSLTQTQKSGLLAGYSTLPAFDDVREGLAQLKEAGFRHIRWHACRVGTAIECGGL